MRFLFRYDAEAEIGEHHGLALLTALEHLRGSPVHRQLDDSPASVRGWAYASAEAEGTGVEMGAGASALHQAARSRLHAGVEVPPSSRTGRWRAHTRRDGFDDSYRERSERLRREHYVGMTRARDGLWLGYLSTEARMS